MFLLIKRGQHWNTWHVHSCSCPSSLASVSVVPSKPHTRISIFPIYYDVLPCKGNIMWSDRMITDTLINWLSPIEEPFSVITFLKIWCSVFFFIKVECWEWKTVFVVVVIQSASCVQFFMTPWTAAHQASLSFTISQSLLKLMSTELVMPSNHLTLSFSSHLQ